jgi:NAD(P)-dependent dehydrogenase (short-subunit alcohol dehydrogenase family)
MFDLTGKRAAVTGAGSGIGRAIAIALAGAGASVAVLDVAEDRAKETADLIETSLSVRGDTSNPSDVEDFARAVDRAWGGVDIWVNNAGRLLVRRFLEMTDAEWHGLLGTNLHGYYYGCRAAARRMVAQGGGRIINVSSVTRQQPVSDMTAYVTGKAAVVGLTVSLALELGPAGVTVNAIAPGATHTGLTVDAYTPEIRGLYEARIAVGRIADPADIAGAAVFLASDEARYVTGHELLVDGGLLLNGNVGFAQTPHGGTDD